MKTGPGMRQRLNTFREDWTSGFIQISFAGLPSISILNFTSRLWELDSIIALPVRGHATKVDHHQ